MDLKELGLVDAQIHWYYQVKLRAVQAQIARYSEKSRNIIDVGAGSGFFSEEIAKRLPPKSVICVDPFYSDEQLVEVGDFQFLRLATVEKISNTDIFLFMDVLEHVEDDSDLLNDYVKHAKEGALFVSTVPAFMSLWSAHDVFLEHFRRYTLAELEQLMVSSGLELVHGRYLYGSLFPAAWILRRVIGKKEEKSDMRPVPSVLNFFLKTFLTIEHAVFANRLFGISAMVVARVPSKKFNQN
jgi:2-polyprenyl-3-methyl-5-hydroxy-6-metoxy-1,4-benzoquinol methylase